MKKIKSPKRLSQILGFNDKTGDISNVDWRKFLKLEQLSKNGDAVNRKNFNYYMCCLFCNNVLIRLDKNRSAYVIMGKENGEEKILNPTRKDRNDVERIYGFISGEDAKMYALTICPGPQDYNQLKIDRYRVLKRNNGVKRVIKNNRRNNVKNKEPKEKDEYRERVDSFRTNYYND